MPNRGGSLEAVGIRRIEAGILDNGTDMDPTMTPYDVDLGRYIDEAKEAFVGKAALSRAPRGVRLMGITGTRAPNPARPSRSMVATSAMCGQAHGHRARRAESATHFSTGQYPMPWPPRTLRSSPPSGTAPKSSTPLHLSSILTSNWPAGSPSTEGLACLTLSSP